MGELVLVIFSVLLHIYSKVEVLGDINPPTTYFGEPFEFAISRDLFSSSDGSRLDLHVDLGETNWYSQDVTCVERGRFELRYDVGGVYVHGDTLVISIEKQGLVFYNISLGYPTDITSVFGSLPIKYSLFMKDDLCFVSDVDYPMLAQLDITDPTNPSIIAITNFLPGSFCGIISNDFILMQNYSKNSYFIQFHVIDVRSGLGSASVYGSFVDELTRKPSNLVFHISGEYIYLSDGYLNVWYHFDESNPASPITRVYYYEGGDYSKNFIVDGDFFYSIENKDGISVFSTSDKANPVQVGYVKIEGSESFVDFQIKNDVLYLISNYLYLVDISDPSLPSLVGMTSFISSFGELLVLGENIHDGSMYAYVICFGNGVHIDTFNVTYIHGTLVIPDGTSEESPELDYRKDILYDKEYCYVADGKDGIKVFSCVNNQQATYLGFLNTKDARSLAKFENIIYLADYDDVKIINVTNPSKPVKIGTIPCSRAEYLLLQKNRGLLHVLGNGKIFIYNISTTLSSPNLLYQTSTSIEVFTVFQNFTNNNDDDHDFLYTIRSLGGYQLEIYNITVPQNTSLIYTIELQPSFPFSSNRDWTPKTILVDDRGYIFIASEIDRPSFDSSMDRSFELLVYDFRDKETSPIFVTFLYDYFLMKTTSTPSNPILKITKDRILILMFLKRTVFFDIRDPYELALPYSMIGYISGSRFQYGVCLDDVNQRLFFMFRQIFALDITFLGNFYDGFPIPIQTIEVRNRYRPDYFHAENDYMYYSSLRQGVTVVNITDSYHPYLLRNMDMSLLMKSWISLNCPYISAVDMSIGWVGSDSFNNQYLYVALNDVGVGVFKMSDHSLHNDPPLIVYSNDQEITFASRVFAFGDVLFVFSNGVPYDLVILDVSNPISPNILSTFDFVSITSCNYIYITGKNKFNKTKISPPDYFYCIKSDIFVIFDVRNLSNPIEKGVLNYAYTGYVKGFEVTDDDNFVYVVCVSMNEGKRYTIDIRNKSKPVMTGNPLLGENSKIVSYIRSNYLHNVHWVEHLSYLFIKDLSYDSISPSIVGEFYASGVGNAVDLFGNERGLVLWKGDLGDPIRIFEWNGLKYEGTPLTSYYNNKPCVVQKILFFVEESGGGRNNFTFDVNIRSHGYYDEKCVVFKCNDILTNNTDKLCNGHGTCIFHPPLGICRCRDYFAGSNCVDCVEGFQLSSDGSLCIPTNQSSNNNNGDDDGGDDSFFERNKEGIIGILIAIGSIGMVLVMIICCCCCCCCCCFLCLFCITSCVFTNTGIFGGQYVWKVRRKQQRLYDEFDKALKSDLLDSSKAQIKVNKALFEIKYKNLQVIRSIGRGGSSMVFQCKWKNKDVAFKSFQTVDVFSNHEEYSYFEKEIEIMSSVRHPYLLKFFGACLHPPRIGIVMEFCMEGDLKYYLSVNDDYEIIERIRILGQICDAMDYLHERKVVHRDLKSENVLLTKDLVPKIIDFGLSRIYQRMSVHKTSKVGTSFYMAPEVVLGDDYTSKCDVFSFAIMMFEVLTSNFVPFGEDIYNVEYRIANDENFRPDVKELSDIVGKEYPEILETIKVCWKKSADERYSFADLKGIFSRIYEKKTGRGVDDLKPSDDEDEAGQNDDSDNESDELSQQNL